MRHLSNRATALSWFAVSLTLATTQPLRAQTATVSCHADKHPQQIAQLLFGRRVGHGRVVTEGEWQRFVTRELTPRFPDGLTIFDATGQWRDPRTGMLVREKTKAVEIVMPGNADDEARLDAVVADYKRDFHQRSVGVIVRPACVSF